MFNGYLCSFLLDCCRGYMAPEYALWGYLTDKADVYSFGVLALEIVAGKNNMRYRPSENFVCLLDWVRYNFIISSLLFFRRQKSIPILVRKNSWIFSWFLLCFHIQLAALWLLQAIFSEREEKCNGTGGSKVVVQIQAQWSSQRSIQVQKIEWQVRTDFTT